MKIHWLVPLTVDKVLQFTSKNEMARALVEIGHTVTTLVAYQKNRVELNGFSEVTYVKTPPNSILNKIKFHYLMLLSILRSDADFILIGFQAAHLLPLSRIIFFCRSRPKLIMDIRTIPVDISNNIFGLVQTARYKFSLIMANYFSDGITTITPMLAKSLKPSLKKTIKIGVWTSGVNLKQFQRTGKNKRKSLGIKNNTNLIYHGVLSPNRGLQNALLAFKLLKKDFQNLKFLIVGSGKGEKGLKDLASQLNLENEIIFTGKVPYEEIPEYIRTANCGILPFPDINWWKVSSPIKLMEYLGVGISIVATDIEAHRSVINKTGGVVLSDNNTPECLADAISRALTNKIRPSDISILDQVISWKSQAIELTKFLSTV